MGDPLNQEGTTTIVLTHRELLFLMAALDLADKKILAWKFNMSDYEARSILASLEDNLRWTPFDGFRE